MAYEAKAKRSKPRKSCRSERNHCFAGIVTDLDENAGCLNLQWMYKPAMASYSPSNDVHGLYLMSTQRRSAALSMLIGAALSHLT